MSSGNNPRFSADGGATYPLCSVASPEAGEGPGGVQYLDAIEFLRRVGEAAERLNHHPDVELRYVNLTLRLTTHDAGNKVTEKDLRLAEEIQKIV